MDKMIKNIDKIDTLCTIYPVFALLSSFRLEALAKIESLPSLNKENAHGA